MYSEIKKKVSYFFDVWQKHLEKRANEVFLVDVGRNLKYTLKESDEITGKVYAYLKSKGIGKEDFVHINLPRSAAIILANLGVWKAGAAFVITEDTLAPERIEYIKKDCSCKLTIDINVWEEILNCQPLTGYEKTDEHDAAFAVYTSGSTGNPKGVLLEYGVIKAMAYARGWTENSYDEPINKYAFIIPFNFVGYELDVIPFIYRLKCFYVMPYSIAKNPSKFVEYCKINQIRSAHIVPSYLRVLGDKLKGVMDLIYTGSEPAIGVYIDGVTIINNYAMSEIAIFVSTFVLDKKYDSAPPIGKIDKGIPYRLIDEDGKDIKDGSIGEICLAAPYTRGYINLPEMTKKTFIDGYLHTGDLARRLPDGNVVIEGRSNDMIKINGNRIEPAEIEAAFKRITKINWCAAKGIIEPKHSYVCLYYKDDIDFDEDEINSKMQEFLPSYMIPTYYMKIEEIPLNPNGKMARKALPIPKINNFKDKYVAPRDEIERILCDSFAKVLNIPAETVSIKDDFYKLGGDSISTLQAVMNTDKLDLTVKEIFKFKTVEKIAAFIRERMSNQTESLDVQLEKELHIPHKLNAMQTKILDYQLYKVKGTMWNLPTLHRFDKSIGAEKLKKAMKEVIKAHPALSFIIKFNDNYEPEFEYKPEMNPEIEIKHTTEQQLREIEKTLIQPFKLINSPLFRCTIFETEEYVYLFFDLYHIIGDGGTIYVFLDDLEKAYFNEPLEKDYYVLELANIEKNKKNIQQYKKYFEKNYSGIDWYSIPEPDFKSRENLLKNWEGIIPIKESDLEKAAKKNNDSRNVISIAAALLALSKYSGKNDVLTNWIYDNRTTKLSKHYVGLMIKTLPVGVHLDKIKNNKELIDEVKKQVNEGIQNSDFDYFTEYEHVYENDCMEINYLGNINYDEVANRINCEYIEVERQDHSAAARFDVELQDTNDGVYVNVYYLSSIYKDENVDRFMKLYCEAFEDLVVGGKR